MRYLSLTDADRRAMLAAIGASSVEELYRDVPKAALLDRPLDLPRGLSELEVTRELEKLAAKNIPAGSVPSFLGCGAYRHHVPAAVDYLVQRGEFLTSYTPYQPEIAQGTLQALFEYQTQVALITGMEVANASLYDGATAAAEGVMMANRLTRRTKAVLAGNLHPHYAETIATYARFNGFEVAARPPDPSGNDDPAALIDGETSCVVAQNPGFFGHLRDLAPLAEACHKAGALLVVVVTEPVSLGLVRPPGAMGADIVAGEGAALGNGLNFGGPYLGLFATRDKYVRQVPGRLAGATHDAEGRRGFVLTLSAREQHIRREKATSNICTNSGLCALAFAIHMALLGEEGFTRLAALNHAKARALAQKFAGVPGVKMLNDSFFNEFTLELSRPAAPIVDKLAAKRILGGVPASRFWPQLPNLLLVAATETNTEDEMDAFAGALREALR
ncbi:MAG TPA: aminomethyl-transferring glycine dehydrogenase subunit GcvPA [Stellaceae bacterium]|nr:aminomethyl-transferring glycine dehydrogenase subunit GcvPA [Stellaceae bacterium]